MVEEAEVEKDGGRNGRRLRGQGAFSGCFPWKAQEDVSFGGERGGEGREELGQGKFARRSGQGRARCVHVCRTVVVTCQGVADDQFRRSRGASTLVREDMARSRVS